MRIVEVAHIVEAACIVEVAHIAEAAHIVEPCIVDLGFRPLEFVFDRDRGE